MAFLGDALGGNQRQESRKTNRERVTLAQQQANMYNQYVPSAMEAMAGRAGIAPRPTDPYAGLDEETANLLRWATTDPQFEAIAGGAPLSTNPMMAAFQRAAMGARQSPVGQQALNPQPTQGTPGSSQPTWIDLMLGRMRSEVARGEDRFAAGTLNRYAKSGMINSSLVGNVLATGRAEGSRQIGQQTADIYRMGDEREAAALAQVLAGGMNQGAQASAGFGQAAQQFGQDTGLMPLLGAAAGMWAGGGFGGGGRSPGYNTLMQDSGMRDQFNAAPPLKPYRGYAY